MNSNDLPMSDTPHVTPRLRVGDVFRIRARHDNGGAPFVRIVTTRPLTVLDYLQDGALAHEVWYRTEPRARPMSRRQLQQFWTRESRNA